MKRLTVWALLAVFSILPLAACTGTTADAYAAANQTYHDEAAAYSLARAVIVDPAGNRKPGVVTDTQWSQFRADEAAVIAADSLVYADLGTWDRTGVKPPSFDSNASALRAAQQRIIRLSEGVR